MAESKDPYASLPDINPDQKDPYASLPDVHSDNLPPKIDTHLPSYEPTAVGRGAAQGVTLGFKDEILGAIQAAMAKASKEGDNKTWMELYHQYRDAERAKNEAAQKESPIAYGVGEFLGGFALPGGSVKTLGQAAKIGALIGGATGLGMSQADLTKGEVQQAVADTAVGATLGAGLGTGFHAAGKYIKGAPKATPITPMTEEAAATEAPQIAGELGHQAPDLAPSNGVATSNINEPVETEGGIAGVFKGAAKKAEIKAGDDALQALGADKAAIEKELGVDSGGFLTPPEFRRGLGEEARKYIKIVGGPDKIKKAIQEDISKNSQDKEKLLDIIDLSVKQKLSNPGAEMTPESIKLSKSSVSNQLAKIADKEVARLSNLGRGTKEAQQNLRKKILEYAQRIQKNDTNPKGLEQIRTDLQNDISSKAFLSRTEDLNDSLRLDKQYYFVVKKRLEELGDYAGQKLGQSLKELNKEQSILIDLGKISTNQQVQSKLGIHPSTFIAGGLGGLVGQGFGIPWHVGAMTGLAAKKTIEGVTGNPISASAQVLKSRTFGNLVAPTFKGIGQGLEQKGETLLPATIPSTVEKAVKPPEKKVSPSADIGKKLYNLSDAQHQQFAQELLKDPATEHYGKVLAQRVESGDSVGKNAVLFAMAQNPKIRTMLKSDEDSEEA